MNVYDFDGTIYDGDSTLDFFFYCMRKHPSILLCVPKQLKAALLYGMKQLTKTAFKERFYCFVSALQDIDDVVAEFWDINSIKIKQWYLNQQREDDVIVSASPEFLLRELCNRIGVKYLIASEVDKQTGQYYGLNCYGEEKLRRFLMKWKPEKIEEFYSDSQSDAIMASYAERAYFVKRKKVEKWNDRNTKGM